jgi:hypothetical protein
VAIDASGRDLRARSDQGDLRALPAFLGHDVARSLHDAHPGLGDGIDAGRGGWNGHECKFMNYES